MVAEEENEIKIVAECSKRYGNLFAITCVAAGRTLVL